MPSLVTDLVARARSNKEQRYHQSARDAMNEAQAIWQTEQLQASMPRPDFSPEEWREIDIDGAEVVPQNLIRVETRFNCPVCYDDFEAGLQHNNCRRIFCRQCLDSWSAVSAACPMCRGHF